MQQSHVIWSGQACPFKRAGVYYGLCDPGTQPLVAQWILPKRGLFFPPGTVLVRPGQCSPLLYLAVRDPSAVRVVPVTASGRAKAKGSTAEFAHVSLVFPLGERPRPQPAPAGAAPVNGCQQCGFVITVGLRTDLEREFHERVILAHADQPYADLCERIMSVRDEFSR